MNHKMIAKICVFFFMLSCLLTPGVVFAEDTSFSVITNASQVKVGDVVSITAQAKGLPPTYGYELKLKYDTSKLELKEIKGNKSGYEFTTDIVNDEINYVLSQTGKLTSEISGDMVLCTATFNVKASGDAAVTLQSVKISDKNLNEQSYTPNTGITISILSNDAYLKGISLSSGTLSPDFSPTQTEYSASVAKKLKSITITPTASSPVYSSLKINGIPVKSGTAFTAFLLKDANKFVIEVKAQDGITTQTYTLVVTRGLNSDASLSKLTVSPGKLIPTFRSKQTHYISMISSKENKVKITATASSPLYSSLKINNTVVKSGTEYIANLSNNVNKFVIEVVAQDGITTKTYTLIVFRLGHNDNDRNKR